MNTIHSAAGTSPGLERGRRDEALAVGTGSGGQTYRILHVIDSGGLYGAERVLLNLATESVALGHKVFVGTIVAPQDKVNALGAAAVAANLDHVDFPMPDGFSFRGLRDILRVAREKHIDVIHSHGYKANILLGAAPRWIRPCVMVCTLHGWTSTGTLSKIALYERIEKSVVRRFDRVIAVSDAILEQIAPGSARKNILKIPNGIIVPAIRNPLPPGNDIESLGTRDRTLKLLSIGRLSYEKGFDRLISAMRVLGDNGLNAMLTIAGEGQRRQELEALITSLGLDDRVSLPGYVENPQQLYSEADVFVLGSRTEGLPMVILEAMSMGIPVIATAVGEIPKILGNNKYGRLVKSGDAQELAGAIHDLVASKPGTATGIASNALERVRSEYSASRMARNYVAVYESSVRRDTGLFTERPGEPRGNAPGLGRH